MVTDRHLCAVVEDDDDYRRLAADFLARGNRLREKAIAFGPRESPLRAELGSVASVVTDPYLDVLGRGELRPETMFSAFHEHVARAKGEGFEGARVAADMDWLLPAAPSADEILGFEVMLDRVVSRLDVTVLCAYRRRSFAASTVRGTSCVHPVTIGCDDEPPFRLVAGAGVRWSLSGSVDVCSAASFAAALRGTAVAPWVLDAAEVEFVDVAGMRAIAEVARSANVPLKVRSAPPSLRRHWRLAGFDRVAPGVRFTDGSATTTTAG